LRNEFYKNEGFRIYKGGISILAQTHAITKENTFFTEQQILNQAKATQTLLDSIASRPPRNINNPQVLQLDKIFSAPTPDPFYKYISKDSLNNYILKGKFRLGSLEYYQKTTNKNIQDTYEGFTHLAISYQNRQRLQAFYSGFNYLIFCGTYVAPTDKRAAHLLKNFGDCVIQIKDIDGFQSTITKHLSSKKHFRHNVKYEPIKIIQTYTAERLDDIDEPIITDSTFNLIYDTVTLPSIFMKPINYDIEHELRLAFEMPKDQKASLDIELPELLDFIEVIQK
jgi:hypothetical protein